MSTQPWYATREEVMSALDVNEPARAAATIDRQLEMASRAVEGQLHRRFYPEQATRYFDWPNGQYARPWRLWLQSNELISVTTLSTGGTTIAPADFFLRRSDDLDEPPYTLLELDLDSSSAFGGGSTPQRDVTITGLFGYRNDETVLGVTTTALTTTTQTAVTVDGPTSAAIGVGSLLRLDTERLTVTGRTQASVGTLGADLGKDKAAVSLPVPSGAAYGIGETLTVDAERLRIDDIAGNTLIVERAASGSVLAAHTTGATIYAPRTLTVTRGAVGTTATTHLTGATVQRWDPPGPVKTLAIAEAECALLQERAGWARTVRSQAGTGARSIAAVTAALGDLRDQVYTSHGRKARIGAA